MLFFHLPWLRPGKLRNPSCFYGVKKNFIFHYSLAKKPKAWLPAPRVSRSLAKLIHLQPPCLRCEFLRGRAQLAGGGFIILQGCLPEASELTNPQQRLPVIRLAFCVAPGYPVFSRFSRIVYQMRPEQHCQLWGREWGWGGKTC